MWKAATAPANRSRLCVKGRFGADYAHHPHRLTKPLIRREGVEKNPEITLDPDNWREVFSRGELGRGAGCGGGGLRDILQERGGEAAGGLRLGQGQQRRGLSFQKLVRAGFGVNNVDHCTRLCHASSVAALLEGIGSGAVSNQVSDAMHSEVAMIIGANPTVNHPVAATVLKNAAARGTKLIVCDPRRSQLAPFADMYLQMKPDSDVALLNGMMHVIIAEGWRTKLLSPSGLRILNRCARRPSSVRPRR